MLGPGCMPLLHVAVADCGAAQAIVQLLALLWMAAQGQRGRGSESTDAAVRVPSDCPAWLQQSEAALLEGPQNGSSRGHALLLSSQPAVKQAAAAELLRQLQHHVQALQAAQPADPQPSSGTAAGASAEAAGAVGRLDAADLLPAADACQASIQLLLLERQAVPEGRAGGAAGYDSQEETNEKQASLFRQRPAVAALAALASSLCEAGAAAGAAVEADVEDAAAAVRLGRRAPLQTGPAASPALSSAAGLLALCNRFLRPADQLLQSGFLPPDAAPQLAATCDLLTRQLQAVQKACACLAALQDAHPLLAALEAAMTAAPELWKPGMSEPGRPSGLAGGHAGGNQRRRARKPGAAEGRAAGGAKSQPQRPVQRRRRRRRLQDVRNPALRAMLAEDGCGERRYLAAKP
jgi:hypothetical protein